MRTPRKQRRDTAHSKRFANKDAQGFAAACEQIGLLQYRVSERATLGQLQGRIKLQAEGCPERGRDSLSHPGHATRQPTLATLGNEK